MCFSVLTSSPGPPPGASASRLAGRSGDLPSLPVRAELMTAWLSSPPVPASPYPWPAAGPPPDVHTHTHIGGHFKPDILFSNFIYSVGYFVYKFFFFPLLHLSKSMLEFKYRFSCVSVCVVSSFHSICASTSYSAFEMLYSNVSVFT